MHRAQLGLYLPETKARSLVWQWFVQQPCSNPSKSPEMPEKVPSSECCHLQAFCTHLKTPANLRAALAWRRSRVRVSSGPLRKPRLRKTNTPHRRRSRYSDGNSSRNREERVAASLPANLSGQASGTLGAVCGGAYIRHVRVHFSGIDPSRGLRVPVEGC